MTSQILKGVSFEQLWLRLGASEKNLCCTRNSGSGGWEQFIAWNPCDVYSAAKDADIHSWENFVAREQQLGRRIFGYLSYDLAYSLHGVKPHARNEMRLPDILFFSFDKYIRFTNGSAEVCANDKDLPGYVASAEEILKRAPHASLGARTGSGELRASIAKEEYEQSFKKIKNYIAEGHVYQINLTHKLAGSTSKSPRELFHLVQEKNNAEFCAYMEADGFEIISASPERFIKISPERTRLDSRRVDARRAIETFPVKGTRPRGTSYEEDTQKRRELEESEKEGAELAMITDLLRNDVGKVSEFGSVEIISPRAMKSFAAVWHAYSHIRGKLRRGVTSADALLSMFPGGSISGCPKKRAIEIIDEVESEMRGVYTGCIGFIDPDDSCDFNIAIRTLLKKGKEVYLQVGGGIVYDSDPAAEYQETLDKAKSFFGILAR